jgi:hypothetical protein
LYIVECWSLALFLKLQYFWVANICHLMSKARDLSQNVVTGSLWTCASLFSQNRFCSTVNSLSNQLAILKFY